MATWFGYAYPPLPGPNSVTEALLASVSAAALLVGVASATVAGSADSSSSATGGTNVSAPVTSVPVNQGNLLLSYGRTSDTRYDRYQRALVVRPGQNSRTGISLSGNLLTLKFARMNMEAGAGFPLGFPGGVTYAVTGRYLDEATGILGPRQTLGSFAPTAGQGASSGAPSFAALPGITFDYTQYARGHWGIECRPIAGDLQGEYDPANGNTAGWSAPLSWYFFQGAGDGSSNWLPMETTSYDDIQEWQNTIAGTAQAGSTATTLVLNAGTRITQLSDIIGARITIFSSNGGAIVTGYNPTTKVATLDRTWASQGLAIPAAGSGYTIWAPTKHHYSWVSVDAAPSAVPLPARINPRFTTALTSTSLWSDMVVPEEEWTWWKVGSGDPANPKPYTTANCQPYFDGHFFAQYPRWLPQRDGKRNVGTFQMPTSIYVGRHGNLLCTNPWRFINNATDGEIKTLAGWRHIDGIASHFYDAGGYESDTFNLELVGDWSRHVAAGLTPGFWETWGMDFYEPTLVTSDAAGFGSSPNPGEPVHTTPPSAFFANTRHNRIDKGWGSPTNRLANDGAWTMQPWVTGLGDPWGLKVVGDIIFVCERTNNRISMWSALTPQTYLGNFLADPDGPGGTTYAHLDPGVRRSIRNMAANTPLPSGATASQIAQSIALVQAQTCILPEGLDVYHDVATGKYYACWGSLAHGQVRRNEIISASWPPTVSSPPTAGSSQVIVPLASGIQSGGASGSNFDGLEIDGNSFWVHVKVIADSTDDTEGGCGPAGTVITSTWSLTNNGFPQCFPPPYSTVAPATQWLLNGSGGTGPKGLYTGRSPTFRRSYNTAAGCGRGIIAWGTAGQGITRISKANASDPNTDNTAVVYGSYKWWTRGYMMLHGVNGFDHFGLTKPWGEDADIDAFLGQNIIEPDEYATARAAARATPGMWGANFAQNTIKSQIVLTTDAGADAYYTDPASTRSAISGTGITTISNLPMADGGGVWLRGKNQFWWSPGGHNDSPFCGQLLFDLKTGLWTRTEDGGVYRYNEEDSFAKFQSDDPSLYRAWPRDTEMRRGPVSTHPYAGSAWLEDHGLIFHQGSAAWYSGNGRAGGFYLVDATSPSTMKWDFRSAKPNTAADGVQCVSLWIPSIQRVFRVQFEGTASKDQPYLIDPFAGTAEQCGITTGTTRMTNRGKGCLAPDPLFAGRLGYWGWFDNSQFGVFTRVDLTPSPVDPISFVSFANVLPIEVTLLGAAEASKTCFKYLGGTTRFAGTRKLLLFHHNVGMWTFDLDTRMHSSVITNTRPPTVTVGSPSVWGNWEYDDINDTFLLFSQVNGECYPYYLPDGVL